MSVTSKEFRALNQKARTINFAYSDGRRINSRVFFIDEPEKHPKTLEVIASHHLCDTCRQAFGCFAYYVSCHVSQNSQPSEENSILPASSPVLQACAPHHSTLRSMYVSLDQDCHVCTILHQRISLLMSPAVDQRKLSVFLDTHALELCWLGKFNVEGMFSRDTVFQFSIVDLNVERSSDSVSSFMEFMMWEEKDMNLFMARHCSRDGDEIPSQDCPFIPGRLEPNTGSESSKDLALGWLKLCRENADGNHEECNQETGGWMPKRLLDVKSAVGNGILKLVTMRATDNWRREERSYITLSHCWGAWGQRKNRKCNLPILTSGNLKKRHTLGLPFESLPKTFRDAVGVAAWFNVRWLWIDSLCVVQDRFDDWRQTASVMSKIYTHALLNISADAAWDARDGLFRDRKIAAIAPWMLSIPSISGSLPIGLSQKDLFDCIDKAPLASRAWVFQERQLARRVLHFTASQLIWECCAKDSSFSSETYPSGARLPQPVNHKWKHYNPEEGDCHVQWAEICELYSGLTLSHQSDKLAAIAGMGREFRKHLSIDDQYVAGMWKNSLPEALLWSVNENWSSDSMSRLGLNIAPTWSWASMAGQVETQSMEFNPLPQWRGNSIKLADVIDILLDGRSHDGSDERTWIRGNISLIIRGVLQPIIVHRDPTDKNPGVLHSDNDPEPKSFVEFREDRVRARPRPSRDYWEDGYSLELDEYDPSETVEAFLLLVQMSDSDSDEQWKLSIRCLVLQEILGQAGSFRRIGVARFSKESLDSLRYRMKDDWHGKGATEVWDSIKQKQSSEFSQEESKTRTCDSLGTESASKTATAQSWEQIYSTSMVTENARYFQRLTPQVIKLI